MPIDVRLVKQLDFLLEADRLRHVLRRTTLADASRRENSAEHSWHLALAAMVLAEHASEPVAIERVVEMVVIHDLVEIDAGDTFAYDEEARRDQRERERQAAARLFGMLPEEQAGRWHELWDEFDVGTTPEAVFARCIDRLQPILLNFASGGVAWTEHGIAVDQVLQRNRELARGAPALWQHVLDLVEEAADRGWLRRRPRLG